MINSSRNPAGSLSTETFAELSLEEYDRYLGLGLDRNCLGTSDAVSLSLSVAPLFASLARELLQIVIGFSSLLPGVAEDLGSDLGSDFGSSLGFLSLPPSSEATLRFSSSMTSSVR